MTDIDFETSLDLVVAFSWKEFRFEVTLNSEFVDTFDLPPEEALVNFRFFEVTAGLSVISFAGDIQEGKA